MQMIDAAPPTSRDDFLPRLPVLELNDTVVVEAGLDIAAEVRHDLESILDDAERERAARFAFSHNRRRYQAAHAALRLVLAHYLDEDPHALRFERGSHGKPQLVRRFAAGLQFNLSHSAGRALVVVSRGREVGIDIEVHRPDLDIDDLARLVLSGAEQRAFAALPVEHRRAAFFRAWVRKESFVKATGEGLSCPLASFDVSLDEHVESALLACRHRQAGATRWTIVPVDVGPGAAAALTAATALRLQGRAPLVWTFA